MAPIYDLFQISPEEAEAFRYAGQLTPAERSVMQQRLFERQGVQGVENLGRMALGLPQPPQADRQSAAAELTALAQRVRPGTEEFYAAAIPILQKYNLVAEAEAMEKQRLALETARVGASPVLKLQLDKDRLLKRPDAASPNVQAAIAAIDRTLAQEGIRAEGGSGPEFIKLYDQYQAAVKAGDTDRATAIQEEIAARRVKQSGERPMSEAERRRVEVTERREDRAEKKDEAKAADAEKAAWDALEANTKAIDEEIRTVQRLRAHPGRSKIIGDLYGALPLGAVAVRSGGAGAIYAQLEGQTFIRALQELKATSKTGASGLGQLTEIEGNKIQTAKAAINRQQPDAQFDRTLDDYIRQLQDSRAKFASALAQTGRTVPVSAPPVSDRPAVAAPVAAPAATPGRRFRTVR